MTDELSRKLRGHMPILDAIRGLAIVMVLAHRFNLTIEPTSVFAKAVSALMELGWVGVQLFFVLSGFLITGILLDTRVVAERKQTAASYFRTFYARRSLRIFPLYYAVLLFAFVILPRVTHQSIAGDEHQIWLWTYLSNWTQPFGRGVRVFSHFWSLAIEEQFYLVWPFVVRALGGRKLPILCTVLVAVSLASRIVLRSYDVVQAEVAPDVVYEITICRIDALAMGAAAAWALRVPEIARAIARRQTILIAATAALFIAGAAITRVYPRTTIATQTIGYSIFAWTFLVLLVVLVLEEARGSASKLTTTKGSVLVLAPLRALGKYSYAMYVFHAPLHHLLVAQVERFDSAHSKSVSVTLAYFLVMTTLTFGAAVVSYHVLEKHFLRLKDRFSMSQKPT